MRHRQPSRRANRGLTIVFTSMVVAVMAGACGCGTSHSASSTVAPARIGPGIPGSPARVVARALGPSPAVYHPVAPGTVIHPLHAAQRVFADALHGFALAEVNGDTYPAATSDGGRTWRIDGPILYAPAAQGPRAVSQAGIAGPHVYFAWGGIAENSVVDVTPDGGRRWWQAFLPGPVLTVSTQHGELAALVEVPASSGPGVSLWLYESRDGRRWAFRSSLHVVG